MENILREDLDHVLENTRELWEEVRRGRIFITGGTGFFGCWLLESFIWANEKLGLDAKAFVLTRSPEAFAKKAPHLASHQSLEFIRGDVRDFTFPEGRFSHVIHAAIGSDSSSPQDPLSLFEGIVKGTRQTLELAKRCDAGKFLLTSSGAVYGKQPAGLSHVPEVYAGAPETTDTSSAYGEGKRVSEFLTATYAEQHGFEAKIARCFAFVGPYMSLDTHFAIGNFMRDVLNNEPICVKGDGTPYRSYLYAADLSIWLWTILFKGKSCRSYNVGSDVGITIADLAGIVAETSQTQRAVRISQEPLPGKPAERYVPSIRRAQSELGLKQNIDLREAIRRTLAWNLNG